MPDYSELVYRSDRHFIEVYKVGSRIDIDWGGEVWDSFDPNEARALALAILSAAGELDGDTL